MLHIVMLPAHFLLLYGGLQGGLLLHHIEVINEPVATIQCRHVFGCEGAVMS